MSNTKITVKAQKEPNLSLQRRTMLSVKTTTNWTIPTLKICPRSTVTKLAKTKKTLLSLPLSNLGLLSLSRNWF